MKRLLRAFILSSMSLSLVACGGTDSEKAEGKGDVTLETIKVLGMSANEMDLNILADQLTKANFDVDVNMQPDYSSYSAAVDAGDWDLALTGWTTVTGNPDYAVRDIFGTAGAYNNQNLSDPKVDELIEKASTETSEKYITTYKELENVLVNENAYMLPLYSSLRMQAVNTDLMEPTMRQPKSRSAVWESWTYKDASLNATRPFIMTQTSSILTSLDPIQANDGSINQLSSNMNIRIINLTDEDEIEADGSLSYNYAIAEGNSEYYFLLRDNVNFSKIEDKKAVDTGVKVGAEDVVFTLNRAKDQNSVPLHKTYGLHSHMEEISIVTDIEELNTIKESNTGVPIMEMLMNGMETPITSLTADKTQADNANGVYQVVKIKTIKPFPQVLNYLAHQSAGILNAEQVTSINSKFDVATYDATKDVCYGDFNAIKSGDNHLWMSGPYALTYVDDYEVAFQKNPGYMVGTEYEPKIKDIVVKFIKDNVSATSAFRSGEVDFLPAVDVTQVEILDAEEKFEVMKRSSNGVSYAVFNLAEGNKFTDLDLRKAVLYAVDQQPFIAVKNNLVNPAFSTISTLIDTGNVHVGDPAKSAEYLAAYQAKAE
ncbi:hypothetical protein AN396_11950 [Candidatus Epulonipiscium fishelsonii]|uniref:Uncharacterized protein n=1 Tax=Candidatus Epulonipiscium fishelsonii TaxID=77094 RepID=A0ACC8X803_9FIRM|nr:hypothetical protein AN396_11950 [Epulopiscium sp. SCG-B11WGA-EpuloA1]